MPHFWITVQQLRTALLQVPQKRLVTAFSEC